MILREFLETSVPANKLLDLVYNNDDIIINLPKGTELPEYDSIANFLILKKPLLDQLEEKGLTLKDFDNIIQKYGWYVSIVNTGTIHLLKMHSVDKGYYDLDDIDFDNIFLHFSPVKPSIITTQGIKAKSSESEDDEFDDRIRYPNARVYLWKLRGMYKSSGNFNLDFIKRFRQLTEILDATDYGNYVYIIKLPKTIQLHYDEEYGRDTPARYITQNVSPSQVMFLSTVSKIREKIKNGEEIIDTDDLKEFLQ